MTTTRSIPRAIAALTLLAAASFGLVACASSASKDEATTPAPELADPSRTGRKLVTEWLTALQQGDTKEIAASLAPNFQIQRADGSYSDRAAYIANPAKVDTFTLGDQVTGLQHGNTLSVHWTVEVDEVINGQTFKRGEAPRLTGFEWNGERWQIVTYANFNLPT
jgi:ABC-type uncharacterized transport system auxiliary subunit